MGPRLIGVVLAVLAVASMGCGKDAGKAETTEEPKGGPKLELNPDYKGN